MPIAKDFLSEFEIQAPITRRFLERLRLLNVAVPASWGPSADEAPAFMEAAAQVA